MKLVMVGRTLSNFEIMSQLLLDGWMGLPTCFWVQFLGAMYKPGWLGEY